MIGKGEGGMIRNVTNGAEVHKAYVYLALVLGTVCGLGPLYAIDEWKFTDDEVTCEECKQ